MPPWEQLPSTRNLEAIKTLLDMGIYVVPISGTLPRPSCPSVLPLCVPATLGLPVPVPLCAARHSSQHCARLLDC